MAKIKITQTRKKLVGIGTLLGALIIIGGVAAWLQFSPLMNKREAATASTDDIRSQAAGYAEAGDVDKGIGVYDQRIKDEGNSDKKLELLLDKARFATSYKRYDEATIAGDQAAKIDSGLSSAIVLAEAYEAKGDKEQAIKFYQMLADAGLKDGVATGRDGDRWQLKIKELRS